MAAADASRAAHAPRPASHPEEPARLAELRLLGLRGGARDPFFDELLDRLAASLGTPSAQLSMIDEHQQWVHASAGENTGDIPRGLSFCAQTILEDGPLIVSDAAGDERFRDLPQVTAPSGIRFYAGVPVKGPHGLPVGSVCVFGDETRQLEPREVEVLCSFGRFVEREMSREVDARAHRARTAEAVERCELTHLLARQAAFDMLGAMLDRATAANRAVALVIADIVDFSAINSAYGRNEGDGILRDAARFIEAAAPGDALVFRIQGDQFGVAFEIDGEIAAEVDSVLGALANSFAQPLDCGLDHPVTLQLAMGTAVFPDRASNVSELVDRAVLALRRGQERRTLAEVFTNELEERLVREVAVEQAFRHALSHEQLSLAYQPKIDLRTGRFVSVEALSRWIDPDLGFVSPAEFIPAAERTGLIVELGRQVLHRSIGDVLDLRKAHPELSVSVNVAAAQLEDAQFAEEVLELLDTHGAPPEALELEVVETSVIENVETAIEILQRLKSAGVGCSIDDFGTGYSSLAYLHRLPVDTIKIDRGFVNNMTQSERDTALVQSIISMAKVLGYDVVAEGVETSEQAALLKEFGCPIGQGYLWSRPLPLEELRAFLRGAEAASSG